MEGGGRRQPQRRLPLRARRLWPDEAPDAARRADHQQRLDLGPRAAADVSAYTATKHAITGLTKSIALDGRAHDIACGQIDIGNALTEMARKMTQGVPQADGRMAIEPTMDVEEVAAAIVHMASLPLSTNVLTMTIMATKMPFVGRG